MSKKPQRRSNGRGERGFVPPRPSIALKRLGKLIGTWGMKGRTFDSKQDNISGRVTIEWLPGGFFMVQHGEIQSGELKVHSLEIVGYDPLFKTFPSYVYSDMSQFHSKYCWEVRGNIVKHWTKGAKYTGKFSADGNTLSGGWRPTGRERKTAGNTYDVIMTRVNSTRVVQHIRAPRPQVYKALIDANSIVKWRFPTGMTIHVHSFEGREGGTFRISLTYDSPTAKGKTSANTDTYHGRFVELTPNERVVEVDEFETADPSMRGEMTVTIILEDAEDGGTDVIGVHEGLPRGVTIADNENGWRMALAKLAIVVEADERVRYTRE